MIVALSATSIAIAAAAAVIIVVLIGQSQSASATAPQPLVPGPMHDPNTAAPAPVQEAPAQAEPPPAPPRAEAEVTEPEATREPERRPRTARRADPSAREPEPARPSRPPSRDIESLIDDVVRGEQAAPRPRERTVENRPPAPSRSDVVAAMGSVSSAVRACGSGSAGVAPVRVVFGGESGRVTSAEVLSSNLPPEVRSCVARAVREARVPPFAQSTFRVDYPFRL
jgi:hypothetical protein